MVYNYCTPITLKKLCATEREHTASFIILTVNALYIIRSGHCTADEIEDFCSDFLLAAFIVGKGKF